MNKLKNNQSGFGAIEGLLTLIIIVLLGVVGFMVYKNQNKSTISSSNTVKVITVTSIPTDWQEFISQDKSVSFAYPKVWGNLTEATRYSIYPTVAISKLTDFYLKNSGGGGGPQNFWYTWNTSTNSLVQAEDLSPPANDTASSYMIPNQLGSRTLIDPTFTAGGFDVYKIQGHGAMNCGNYDFVFKVKDKIVDINTFLCERGGQLTAESQGAQYSDIYTSAFANFYKYL